MYTRAFRVRSARRRGTTMVTVAVCMMMMLSFAALTLDVGLMFNTKTELQRAADSAALAGTLALMNENRLRGGAYEYEVIAGARTDTANFAAMNEVRQLGPAVNQSDVQVGYLADPDDPNEPMDFSDPSRYNAVRVMVRRDDQANGPIDLFFARIFGRPTAALTAEATAAMMDGIEGFRVTEQTGNAELLPLVLREDVWNVYLAGLLTIGDNYAYDPATGDVSAGPDGIEEMNLYPGGAAGQLPPGNFGTVDIGSASNSTADLSRQILEGISAEDLEALGGALLLGDDGTLELNGDTGLSAAISSDLEAIIGLPRAIPLFSTVTGNGNNSSFTIVGFVGIRVMYVQLTGAMASKQVLIQPALVIDDSAVSTASTGIGYYVYQPVRLVR